MPDADPRALALRVLDHVGRGKFAAPTLDHALSRHDLTSQQAGLVTDLVYGTLRRERWLEAALTPLLRDPEGLPQELRWLLRAGAYEKLFTPRPAHALVNAWVSVAKRRFGMLSGLVNAVLRRVELPPVPEPVRLGLPDFLYSHWRDYFGDVSWAAALNEPAPLWLTVFPGGREALRSEGTNFEAGPLPDTVSVHGASLRELAAYRQGLVQPQNPSSLLAAMLLDAPAGARVLDLAGGAGIKAAWLAAKGARVTSYDLRSSRQRAGRRNLERLGLEVEFKTHDLRRPLADSAPYVLLDAPCLGTGTLRGHPELRRRLREDDLKESAALQALLLDNAARSVASAGVLVYAVCSLTEPEGEGLVAAFLDRHPDFSADTPAIPLPRLRSGAGVYVKPVDGLDGFYYARLRRG